VWILLQPFLLLARFAGMDKYDPPITVLIVENLSLIRMNATAVAEGTGFKVYEASDADEAISMLRAHTDIRILFTDVTMPGSIDGLKLAHYVSRRWPPVKIILTSGHPKFRVADIPQQSEFIAKPYRPAQITNALTAMAAQLRAA
jgi:two-component system, response regulator PdtaR